MKFTCTTADLIFAIRTCAAMSPHRAPRYHLKCIRIVAGDSVALFARDTVNAIRCDVETAAVAEKGDAIVGARWLSMVADALPYGEVTVFNVNSRLRITTTDRTFESGDDESEGVTSGDLKTIGPFEGQNYFLMQGSEFAQGIRQTIFATDDEIACYALGGVLMEPGDGIIKMVATDSRRMSLTEVPARLAGAVCVVGRPVMPVKVLEMFAKNYWPTVKLAFGEKRASLAYGPVHIDVELAEGKFPRYQDVVTPWESAITLPVEKIKECILACRSTWTEEDSRVTMRVEDDEITFNSQSRGRAEVRLPMPGLNVSRSGTFDPRFLLNFLDVLGVGEFEMQFGNDKAPQCVLRSGCWSYVVMPCYD